MPDTRRYATTIMPLSYTPASRHTRLLFAVAYGEAASRYERHYDRAGTGPFVSFRRNHRTRIGDFAHSPARPYIARIP